MGSQERASTNKGRQPLAPGMNSLLTLLTVSIVCTHAAPATDMNSKEQLTETLTALKSRSQARGSEATTRSKGSDPEDAGRSEDDISGAALILAKYILDTGDIDGVMEFLQGMVRAGKITDKEGMSYVSVLLETLKRLKSVMPPASSDSDSLSLGPSLKSQETDSEQKLHRDNIKTISEEQESLTRSKAAIEDKIKDLETKKMEEEEAIKRREMVTKLVNDVEEGERDNETILKINQIIEEDKTRNLISKNLYLHVKEALIETAVENMAKL